MSRLKKPLEKWLHVSEKERLHPGIGKERNERIREIVGVREKRRISERE